jgi:hypothetical protein
MTPWLVELATVVLFCWVIRDRDIRERLERADLLNRIQAPEVAVAESLPDTDLERLYESEADLDRPQPTGEFLDVAH